MNTDITSCADTYTTSTYCQLSPTCKGWGCRFLTAPIEEIPVTVQEKAKLFSKGLSGGKAEKEYWSARTTVPYSLMKYWKI